MLLIRRFFLSFSYITSRNLTNRRNMQLLHECIWLSMDDHHKNLKNTFVFKPCPPPHSLLLLIRLPSRITRVSLMAANYKHNSFIYISIRKLKGKDSISEWSNVLVNLRRSANGLKTGETFSKFVSNKWSTDKRKRISSGSAKPVRVGVGRYVGFVQGGVGAQRACFVACRHINVIKNSDLMSSIVNLEYGPLRSLGAL